MSRGEVVVHNGGAAFNVPALHPNAAKFTPAEIVAILRKSSLNSKH
jgi:hypothetical protein